VNTLTVNNGSYWSTSTFRFTAPVTGIYYLSYSGIVGDGTVTQTAGYYALIVNGANTPHYSYRDSLSAWELQHAGVLYRLAAGDTVAWSMNLAPGPASSYAGGAYRNNHNTVTIWLIG
jgi:hypothetical protein